MNTDYFNLLKQGYHSVLSQSLTKEQPMPGRIIKVSEVKTFLFILSMFNALQSEDIKSFSSDPSILAFAEYFCTSGSDEVRDHLAFQRNLLAKFSAGV